MKDLEGRQEADSRDREPKLTIRIIGQCDFLCPSCSTFSSPQRKGLLRLRDLERILRLLSENRFQGPLHLSGGETTLHPELTRMIILASRDFAASKIVVFTNGNWIGTSGWRARLKSMFSGPNVLIRFSLDPQHVQGKAIALSGKAFGRAWKESKKDLFDKAGTFLAACREEGAKPGENFDFAYKGIFSEAKSFLAPLGEVPVYLIRFQRNPDRRPKRMGFLAVDLDHEGRPRVYPTLGHIPGGEALGSIETLPLALEMNRRALREAAERGHCEFG